MLTADKAIANVLKTVPLFADMGDESMGDLASACTLVQIAAGEAVFQEKDPAQEVYFVVGGQIRLTCSTVAGPDVVVGYVDVGGVLGEMGVIDPAPRSASATAAEDSIVLRLPGEALGAFIAEGHPVGLILLGAIRRSMTQRIRTLDERIEALFLLDNDPTNEGPLSMTDRLRDIWAAMRTGG